MTLRACAVTSVPMPSPATTAIRATLTSTPSPRQDQAHRISLSRSSVRRSQIVDWKRSDSEQPPRDRGNDLTGAVTTKTRGFAPAGGATTTRDSDGVVTRRQIRHARVARTNASDAD
ncbi:hypothetical protein Ahu01nite_045000 [Winogradskya humida]|uniref:Uncharacterized protein n=1 Tax=Winogradskya humida TaxID=113566 RepID=A0ABQ3ZSA9_9ACTN|nr:hypothetical protein Ahu01nite_045000 [Actinoplanes humidus]